MATALTKCLKQESVAIELASEKLNPDEVEKSLELINKCSTEKSKLLISGVGKSGIVARKIAATFSSIGIMSLYLNPLDALHGDIGIASKNDVCILISNSGETVELIEIIPHLKRRKISTIALVGNKKSTIANESTAVLEAGVNKEVCPLNLAPTASTAVAMAIGDALAAVWMERKGISPRDFAINHPAGSLGKKLTMTVADLMIPKNSLHLLSQDSSITEIISFITKDGIGSGWVVAPDSNDKLLGLITDGDLRRSLQESRPGEWGNLLAKDLMTENPLIIKGNILVIDALRIMENNRKKSISVMAVFEKNCFIGIIRMHDIVKAGI